MLSYATLLSNSQTICSRMCFCCDQIYPDVRSWRQHGHGFGDWKYRERTGNEIGMYKVECLIEFCKRDYEGFLQSFSLVRFREWYGDAFKESDILTEKPGPWRCKLLGQAGEFKGWVLCNAEDVVRCEKCRFREEGVLCSRCEVPLCHECTRYIFS